MDFMNVKIQRFDQLPPQLILIPKQMETRSFPMQITLSLGTWRKRMKVQFTEKLNKDVIGLSSQLYPELTIPEHLPYEIKLQQSNLLLGPIIGMIIARREITEDMFEEFEPYLKNYQKLNGIIYLCAESGIDPQKKTIQGFYYNPDAVEESPWTEGVFPYPGAVYRRVLLTDRIYYDLAREVRGKIFNSYLFNKYEMWNVLSKVPSIHKYLPETAVLRGIDNLDDMLRRYESVYLKPVFGGYGLGIVKVDKMPNGYRLFDGHTIDKHFTELSEMEEFIQPLEKQYYIVQQAVPLTFDHRHVDFRLILQKDKSRTWKSSGMLARFGRIEKVYTNEVSNVTMGYEALMEIFSLTREEAFQKEKEITDLCIEASRLLEQYYAGYGDYADFGIDVIVDQGQRIWLLEVNKFHEHDVGLLVDSDTGLYERIVTTPLEYVKALAGFR